MANQNELFFHPVPCTACRMWDLRDTRSLARPVAVDITSRDMMALVDGLQAGLELVAELSPSPFPGRAAYGSWWYWLLSAVCTLQICTVFELAIAKLHAFARADGGLRASLPQMLLLLEILLCLLRFVFCTLDPFFSHWLIPFHGMAVLFTLSVTLSTVSSALFLVFFLDAAASSGMASVTIADPRYRRGLLWVVVAALGWHVLFDSLSFTVRPPEKLGRFYIIVKCIYLGGIFPSAITALACFTTLRVRKSLRAAIAPPRVVARITQFMIRAIIVELTFMTLGVGYMWAIMGLREWDIVWTALLQSLLITKSFQHVAAFKPLGVTVWRGPISTLRWLAARALFNGCGYCTSTRIGLQGSPVFSSRGSAIVHALTTPAVSQDDTLIDDRLLLGVTLCFLRDFCEAHEFMPSDPTRKASNLIDAAKSVCVMQMDARTSDGRGAIGKATHFVSHAQSCSLLKMIDAMEGFLRTNSLSERNTYLWIDVFCLPQSNVQAYVARIGEIERRIGSVVMVLDPWNAPVCLTRVWCLYEVVHTVPSKREAGTEFHLALPSSERASFVAAYEHFGKAHIEEVLAAFDARKAEAAMESDKLMIFRLIASMFNVRTRFYPGGV
mmetsp:Transcript_34617/g.81671  ORF Transcript_34617/g.81671 Transcript_34617/m.81671 type:complete len:612 (+) Transcript_34617:397-2232(+)